MTQGFRLPPWRDEPNGRPTTFDAGGLVPTLVRTLQWIFQHPDGIRITEWAIEAAFEAKDRGGPAPIGIFEPNFEDETDRQLAMQVALNWAKKLGERIPVTKAGELVAFVDPKDPEGKRAEA